MCDICVCVFGFFCNRRYRPPKVQRKLKFLFRISPNSSQSFLANMFLLKASTQATKACTVSQDTVRRITMK